MQQWSPLWRTIGTRPKATFSTSTRRKKRDYGEKMSKKTSWQHPEKILTTSSNIMTTSFNILPRCPAPEWGRLCVKVADYWGEQLLRKVFRSARSWRRPGCLRRCWWTWPGWSGSSPSCGALSQSATWRLPQRQNAQRELLAPARKMSWNQTSQFKSCTYS